MKEGEGHTKIEKWIESFMLNQYIERGKVVSFQSLQDVLASMGYRYTVIDGKKKLWIRRKIYPIYSRVKRKVERIGKEREAVIRTLEMYMRMYEEGKLNKGFIREYYSRYKDRLTTRDREYWGKVIFRKKEKKVEL